MVVVLIKFTVLKGEYFFEFFAFTFFVIFIGS